MSDFKMYYGYSESKTWFESVMSPDGKLQGIGMGMLKKFGQAGELLSVDIKPTGVVVHYD